MKWKKKYRGKMAREFAIRFYNSKQWHDCRRAYIKQCGGLCERCKAKGQITAGVIVHHKIRIEPETINNADVALNFSNLELLCLDCHNAEHGNVKKRRYRVDEFGMIAPR